METMTLHGIYENGKTRNMVLVDTDIFIDYFRDYEPANAYQSVATDWLVSQYHNVSSKNCIIFVILQSLIGSAYIVKTIQHDRKNNS